MHNRQPFFMLIKHLFNLIIFFVLAPYKHIVIAHYDICIKIMIISEVKLPTNHARKTSMDLAVFNAILFIQARDTTPYSSYRCTPTNHEQFHSVCQFVSFILHVFVLQVQKATDKDSTNN